MSSFVYVLFSFQKHLLSPSIYNREMNTFSTVWCSIGQVGELKQGRVYLPAIRPINNVKQHKMKIN